MLNNLFLNRLMIYTKNGTIAYDEKFHKGINIIRGDNSSGKSTITHFIFYVLGGAFKDFVPEAKTCSSVLAEVEMNKAVFTIRREVEVNKNGNVNDKSPIYIYWGNLIESHNPPPDKIWSKFGFNTTDNTKSFSNVFFDNLSLPIVKGDSNITMHQVLRLLYVDQESPTNSLFYYEHFDSQLTRETVSDLLLGVYNEELYENKKRLISAEKELEALKSELKASERFFTDPLTKNTGFIRNQIENKKNEILKIEDEIISKREKTNESDYNEKSKLNFQLLNEKAIEQRSKSNQIKNEIELLRSEILDSEFFIETLNNKIKALKNSVKTRAFLGNLPLEYCPECLNKIKISDDVSKCKLCKENKDDSYGSIQARRMELEITFQIKESAKLLDQNKKKLLEISSLYESENIRLQQLQRQVNSALSDVKAFNQETIDNLYISKGYAEGEINQYRTLLESAELYEKLSKEKDKLQLEVNHLKDFISKSENRQNSLKVEVNKRIREEGLYLLNNDLVRQDEFVNANEFFIDFSNNITFLSNKYAKYSASSNFYLKVAARFSIFLASLSVEKMRFPRFIFADNMEDKGIELPRAQNFQQILIDRLSQYDENSYQVIYTTSYITDELNKSKYVVGEYYTKNNHSLKI